MEKGVLDYLEKFEQHGYIENFRIVGKQEKSKHVGGPNNNEFVHKLVEAAGYYATRSPDIKSSFARIIADVLSAQADNGYLNTFYDNPIIKEKSPGNRFRPGNRFEFLILVILHKPQLHDIARPVTERCSMRRLNLPI